VSLAEIAHDEWKLDEEEAVSDGEIKERVEELKQNLKDSLRLDPEDMKEHLREMKKNLNLGKGNLKSRLSRLGEHMKTGGLDEAVKNNEKPLKNSLIAFIAWAVLRLTTPYHRRIISFLLGPLGLLAMLAVSIAYGFFDREVLTKMKEMKSLKEFERGDHHDGINR
jgi:hypothetical protein